MESGTKTTALS